MTVTMPSRRHITTAAHAMHIDPDALISYRVDREYLVVCSQLVCLEPAAPRQDLVLVHQKTEWEFKPDIQQGRARSRPASAPSCPRGPALARLPKGRQLRPCRAPHPDEHANARVP